MTEYNFVIPINLSEYMYGQMQEGQADEYTKGGFRYTGTERGGNFEFEINDQTITAVSINDSKKMARSSSLNTGDYPFTFHSHPILIKERKIRTIGGTRRRRKRNGGAKINGSVVKSNKSIKHKPKSQFTYTRMIDNYPNLISDEDLIGCIEDNIFSNIVTKRKICGSAKSTRVGGISMFDIVAAPYGLFVYRPSQGILPSEVNPMSSIEIEVKYEFDGYKNKILPKHSYIKRNNYNNAVKDKESIENYISQLKLDGFHIDFFTWEEAQANEISFTLENITPEMIARVLQCNV